jgi:hypothetical protein
LAIQGYILSDKNARVLVSNLKYLEELQIGVSDENLSIIARGNLPIKRLRIASEITNSSFKLIPTHFPYLEKLHIDSRQGATYAIVSRTLGLAELLKGCRYLEYLYINIGVSVGDLNAVCLYGTKLKKFMTPTIPVNIFDKIKTLPYSPIGDIYIRRKENYIVDSEIIDSDLVFSDS